ncbi:MAG: zinc-dependent metalloprotease [Flaviflexus sp.]|nr:zinc-dependent metalloprotease [Flaviflexus sp.]
MIDPLIAFRRVRQLAPSGPRTTTARARATVAGLRDSARRAPGIVAELTEMEHLVRDVEDIPVSVLTRPGWAQAAAQSVGTLLESGPAAEAFNSRIASEEFAAALAFLAPRILGQFDPFALTALPDRGLPIAGRLLLVAPNIAGFDERFDLDRRDVHMFVCVHEFTHAFQFTAAPWLRDVLTSKVHATLEQIREDSRGMHEDLADIMTIMSVLEGHAEYVMNRVPIARIPSIRRVTGAMARRRSDSSPLREAASRLLGLDMKMAQYRKGEEFIAQVARRAGHSGVNALWADPLHLPSPAELDQPSVWMARVLG